MQCIVRTANDVQLIVRYRDACSEPGCGHRVARNRICTIFERVIRLQGVLNGARLARVAAGYVDHIAYNPCTHVAHPYVEVATCGPGVGQRIILLDRQVGIAVVVLAADLVNAPIAGEGHRRLAASPEGCISLPLPDLPLWL